MDDHHLLVGCLVDWLLNVSTACVSQGRYRNVTTSMVGLKKKKKKKKKNTVTYTKNLAKMVNPRDIA